MSTFGRILFSPQSQSGNAEAIERATALARLHGAALTMVGIVPEPTRLQTLLQPAELLSLAIERSTADRVAEFELWCPDPVDVDRTAVVVVGRPAEALLDLVRTEGYDLVIVTADRGRAPDPLAKRLVRQCPCPVWVMQTPVTSSHGIVAAIDPDPDAIDLNRSILGHALALQGLTGGAVHVVAAWEFYGEASLRHSAYLHPRQDRIDTIVAAEHDIHRRALEDVLAMVGDVTGEVTAHLVRGRAEQVIIELIDANDIGLLVMGTVAREGLPALVIGNTAEHLLDRVDCSIVAVKPPWFATSDDRPGE